MLAKAKEFKSPSTDHDNYANFLVSQLEDSIRFDCGTLYYDELKEAVSKEAVSFEAWQSKRIKDLHHDTEYHRNAHREEVERTESHNRWVRQLKEALGIVPQVV